MYVFLTQNVRKMWFGVIVFIMCSILVHYIINNTHNKFLEVEKCPFCYGNDYCHVFENNYITFSNLTFSEILFNLINVKNVYIANYNGTKVILKKLAHNWELQNIDKMVYTLQNSMDNCLSYTNNCSKDFTANIMEYLINENKNKLTNLKICSLSAINQFTNLLFALNSHLNTSFMTATLWTTILANVEPLLLQVLLVSQPIWGTFHTIF